MRVRFHHLHYIFAIASLFVSIIPSAVAGSNGGAEKILKRSKFTHTWAVTDSADQNKSIDLEARIVETRSQKSSCDLHIYSGDELVFSDSVDLFPITFIELDNHNLAVLWSHADGAMELEVLAYRNNKIKKVLFVGCGKMRPEFVYQTKGHIFGEGYQDKNGKWQTRGGPFYSQRIVVPYTDWTDLQKPYLGFTKDLQPIRVDVYTWDDKEGKYQVRKNIPWSKRLQYLGGE